MYVPESVSSPRYTQKRDPKLLERLSTEKLGYFTPPGHNRSGSIQAGGAVLPTETLYYNTNSEV